MIEKICKNTVCYRILLKRCSLFHGKEFPTYRLCLKINFYVNQLLIDIVNTKNLYKKKRIKDQQNESISLKRKTIKMKIFWKNILHNMKILKH